MIAFSPGLAQSSFELLELISRRALPLSQVRMEFSKIGVMLVSPVIESVQELNWIKTGEDGSTIVTVAGKRILSLSGFEHRVRQALLDYIDINRPPWIQNAPYGRARVLAFTASGIKQTFIEAGLATGTDKDVVEFWDELAIRARGQANARLNTIGRAGERLTIEYERLRTRILPQWVSIESNADGYDVLSVASSTDDKSLLIEVKATSIGIGGNFHLTASEWECAIANENHVFHLWDISKNVPALAVVTKSEVNSEVAINQGSGLWESVEIPFAAFERFFLTIHTCKP